MVSAIPIPSRPTSVSVRCDPHFQGNAPVSCTKDRKKKKKTPAHHCKRKKKEMQDGLAKKNDNAGLHKVVCVYVGDIPRRNAVQCFCPIWSGRQANAPPPAAVFDLQPPLQHCHSSMGAVCLFFFPCAQ